MQNKNAAFGRQRFKELCNMSVYRIYVEKKEPFAVEAAGVLASLRNDLE